MLPDIRDGGNLLSLPVAVFLDKLDDVSRLALAVVLHHTRAAHELSTMTGSTA